MTKNDIKKALYKEKPVAKRLEVTEFGETFITTLENDYQVSFFIPNEELFDADGKYLFEDNMDAKLLIRWISNSLAD